MKFFHVYNEECFEGLVKNGLINEETGFKMQNVFSVPKELQFNEFAKCGGRLHSLIKEGNYPFYVDRIAGGITYYKYDYDKKLIEEYKNILGDWFLGFQLHESASNRRDADWKRIFRLVGHGGPYDVKTIENAVKRSEYARLPSGEYLFNLSHGSPEEYAKLMYPKNHQEFVADIEWMFKKRMEETDGRILPCDSYYLFTKSQDELGMNTFMPEVGCQIAGMRIAVALSRGIASYSGKRWGTYYETWICVDGKCSMPCYNTDPRNEWYLTQETHPDDFTSFGENGGSSRYLQERIYYHSLMSGADYMAEEWGLNNSYSDMKTFDLSPYGKVKKDFINDSLKMKGMKAYTPFAVVLPMDYKCVQIANPFENYTVGNHRIEYMRYPLVNEEKDYIGHVEDVIKLFFGRYGTCESR